MVVCSRRSCALRNQQAGDIDWEVEPANNIQLLEIVLAEEGQIRRPSGETALSSLLLRSRMAWTERIAPAFAQPAHPSRPGETVPIHLRQLRRTEHTSVHLTRAWRPHPAQFGG